MAARNQKSPFLQMTEPYHFSDYGFDPQIDYFQVLQDARKHMWESSKSLSSMRFKLKKPISKDDRCNKKRWWKKALLFMKCKWVDGGKSRNEDVHRARARDFRAATVPVGGSVEIPYLSLRQLTVEQQAHRIRAPPSVPLYLVT